MKTLWNHLLLSAVALALVAVPALRVPAQDVKPVAVVAVNSVDELLADVDFLSQAANAPDVGGMVKFMARGFTAGVDKTKPSGAFITLDETNQPKAIGFVPVTDLKTVLDTLKDQVGEPKDAGDGILELNTDKPNSVFVKEQGGWAFLSDSAANLKDLPQAPETLLVGLEKQYDIAVRVNMQNVPPALKQQAVAGIREGFERSLENQRGRGGPDRELAEKLARNSLKSVVAWIEESDQVTLGFAVDSAAKTTYIDFSVTALPGTGLARRMAMLSENKSDYAGFLLPEAAATLHFSGRLAAEDIEQVALMLAAVRDGAIKEIEKDKDLKDEQQRAAAKEVLGTFLDVIRTTVESGKLDGGAVFLLKPDAITFAAGGYVSDGAALETAFKKVVDLTKDEPDAPDVKLDVENHGGIRFHSLSFTLPDDEVEARQFFGDKLDVAIGIGPKTVYLAFGKDSIETLKKVIDKSAADANVVLPASQFNIALTPILKFAASIDENPMATILATTIENSGGKDRISITSKPIPGGALTRLQVEEGVLQLIGQAAKLFGPGAGQDF